MSDLEYKIEELKRKLAIKNAYLQVDFKFPKKIDPEIKEEVTNKLKELCNALAEDQEDFLNTDNLSEEDVTICKMLVNKVKNKTPSKDNQTPKQLNTPTLKGIINSQQSNNNDKASFLNKSGELMYLDNVDPAIRAKIEPNCNVQVVGIGNNDIAYVRDPKGRKFNIPLQDIQFNEEI